MNIIWNCYNVGLEKMHDVYYKLIFEDFHEEVEKVKTTKRENKAEALKNSVPD